MTTAIMVAGIVMIAMSMPQVMASAASANVIPLAATPVDGLETMGTTFTKILSWLMEIMNEVIFGNPVLMIGITIFVIGAVIALIYRMVRGG